MLPSESVGIVSRNIAAVTGYQIGDAGVFLDVPGQRAGRDDEMRMDDIIVILLG